MYIYIYIYIFTICLKGALFGLTSTLNKGKQGISFSASVLCNGTLPKITNQITINKHMLRQAPKRIHQSSKYCLNVLDLYAHSQQ